MFWFKRKKVTKRSAIIKRRGITAERLIFFIRRVGATVAIIIFIGWLGAWFFMSGTSVKFSHWTENKFLAMTSGSGFKVSNILVEGREFTDPEAIKAIINLGKGDPLLAFNADEAREMLEKLSWVKSAQVERRFPDTIYINLKERVPIALWQRDKRLSLIDTEGFVLTDNKLERFKDFIIVVGKEVPSEAPKFLKTISAEPLLLNRIETASFISGRRWDLILKGNITVKLPEENLSLAIHQLVKKHEDEKLLDKDIKMIDIREPTRITVRTKPGAVQKYQTKFEPVSGVGGTI